MGPHSHGGARMHFPFQPRRAFPGKNRQGKSRDHSLDDALPILKRFHRKMGNGVRRHALTAGCTRRRTRKACQKLRGRARDAQRQGLFVGIAWREAGMFSENQVPPVGRMPFVLPCTSHCQTRIGFQNIPDAQTGLARRPGSGCREGGGTTRRPVSFRTSSSVWVCGVSKYDRAGCRTRASVTLTETYGWRGFWKRF